MAGELGFALTEKQINAIFENVSSDHKTIKFSEFAKIMEKKQMY